MNRYKARVCMRAELFQWTYSDLCRSTFLVLSRSQKNMSSAEALERFSTSHDAPSSAERNVPRPFLRRLRSVFYFVALLFLFVVVLAAVPPSIVRDKGYVEESNRKIIFEISEIWHNRSLKEPLRYQGKIVDDRLLNATSPLWLGNYQELLESAGVPEGIPTPGLTTEERAILADSLSHFARIAEHANITYFLHAGSLLGSVRHHGIIPWDDEVDVYVNYTEHALLGDHLERYLPDYLRLDKSGNNWKICLRGRPAIDHRHAWSFPFLDIAFFVHDDVKAWELNAGIIYKRYARKNVFNMSKTIFPLVRRPFMNMWLPTPKRPMEYLRTMYTSINCRNHYYSHRHETAMTVHDHQCSFLYGLYPFAHKTAVTGGQTNEIMVLDGRIVQWVAVDSIE